MKKRAIFKLIICGALIFALYFPCFAAVVITQQPYEDLSTDSRLIREYTLDLSKSDPLFASYNGSTFIRQVQSTSFSGSDFDRLYYYIGINSYLSRLLISTGQLALGNEITISLPITYNTDTTGPSDFCNVMMWIDDTKVDDKVYDLINVGLSGTIDFTYTFKNNDIDSKSIGFVVVFYTQHQYISVSVEGLYIKMKDSRSLADISKKTQEDVADIKDKIDDIADTEEFVPDVETFAPDQSFDDEIEDALDVTDSIDSSAASWWAQLWSTLFDSELFGFLSPIAVFGVLLGVFL